MARIVFIMSHVSHQNASFGLARKLQMANHEVVFAGAEIGIDGDNLIQNAENQGFIYYVLNPNEPFRQSRKETYSIDESFEFFIDNLWEGELFLNFISTQKPDLILLDIHLAIYAIPLYVTEIPIVFISTKILTLKDEYCPPLNYFIIPDETEVSRRAIEKAWMDYFSENGLNHEYKNFIVELSSKYKFPIDDFLCEERCVIPFALKFPEIILWPKNFDFPRSPDKTRNIFFLGGMLDVERQEQKLDWENVAINRPIIYCAMGTRYSGESDKKIAFLIMLIEVFAKLPQYQVIISAGKYFQGFYTEIIPANIKVLSYAPQLDILAKSALMINHGGGNSLLECIHFGVPVLSYPCDGDQEGCGARVAYFKIGLVGQIGIDTHDDIKEKVETILEDETYRQNINKIREEAYDMNIPQKAVELIESFVK